MSRGFRGNYKYCSMPSDGLVCDQYKAKCCSKIRKQKSQEFTGIVATSAFIAKVLSTPTTLY